MVVSLVDPFVGIVWEELTDSDSGSVNYNRPTSQRKWLVTAPVGTPVQDILATSGANIPETNPQGAITHFILDWDYKPASPTLGNTLLVVANYAFQVDYKELVIDTSAATAKREQAFDTGTYYAAISPGGEVTPGESLLTNALAYNAATDYARGDYATSGGVTYSSKADDNNGNSPPDASWWAVATPVTVPDFKGSVIDGVEVPDEKFDFTFLFRTKYSTLSAAYLNLIGTLNGHSNSSALTLTYKGQTLTFGPEELLYLGATDKVTSEDGYEITLKLSKQKSKLGGTKTTVAFTQPAVNSTVVVTVASETLFAVGNICYGIEPAAAGIVTATNASPYEVTAKAAGSLTLKNLGGADADGVGNTIPEGTYISLDRNPLIIGQSGMIRKLGWRYLKPIVKERIIGGQRVQQIQYVVVNKVIPTADLRVIGIFD